MYHVMGMPNGKVLWQFLFNELTNGPELVSFVVCPEFHRDSKAIAIIRVSLESLNAVTVADTQPSKEASVLLGNFRFT